MPRLTQNLANFQTFKQSIYNSCEHMLRRPAPALRVREPSREPSEEKDDKPIERLNLKSMLPPKKTPSPPPAKAPVKRVYEDSDSDD